MLEVVDEMFQKHMTSFVYKWTFKPNLNWYVGFHKGTPEDGYICSSPSVKRMIITDPENWERTIIDYGTVEEMYNLETEILQTFNARKDTRSFNKSNNTNGVVPGWNAGIPMKEEARLKMIANKTGKEGGKLGKKYPGCHSDEAREKKRLLMLGNIPGNKGIPWSEERRKKQELAHAKRKAKQIIK